MGLGLKVETGAERTTIIVDNIIFDLIQQVRDTGFHLKVDEEQWKIKRQAKWVWSPRAMSGLRLPDTPHAQIQTNHGPRKQKSGDVSGG